jgi:2-methylisocitrate lyase-like PEP mutase family enzyme
MGIDEVIRRCKMFEQAGADMVMPENLIEKEDMLKVTTAINNVPILADVCEFTTHQIYSDKELKDMGYKMVIHPLMSILCEAKILMRLYSHYKENGTTMELSKEGRFMPRPEYQDLVGYSDEMSIRRLID